MADAVTKFGQAAADKLNLRLARSGEAVVEFQIAKWKLSFHMSNGTEFL